MLRALDDAESARKHPGNGQNADRQNSDGGQDFYKRRPFVVFAELIHQ